MKIRTFPTLLTILFIVLISSCRKNEPEWKGTIEEENGVSVIKNPKESLFVDYQVEFIEDLSIGIEEGDEHYMFFNPRAVDSDSEGNIYILEYGASRIRKYDPKGQYLLDLTQRGQGPGELEYPFFFCIDAQNRIFIIDIRKIVVLDQNGLYLNTIKFDSSMGQIALDNQGQIIISYRDYVEKDGGNVEEAEKIGIFNPKSQDLTDFFIQERMTFRTIQGDDLYFEFPYFVRWGRDSNGNIYAATATDYTIHAFSTTGKLFAKFTRDFEPLPVESSIRKRVLEQLSTSKLPRAVSDSQDYKKFLNSYPVFKTISIDEKDRIWMESYIPRVAGQSRQDSIFNVFSSEGKYLFDTKIDHIIYPRLIFKNGYIYTLVVDESGFSRILRLKYIEK
ncbi:6-bladed beta-propeller [Acidobacteriota bacterium]